MAEPGPRRAVAIRPPLLGDDVTEHAVDWDEDERVEDVRAEDVDLTGSTQEDLVVRRVELLRPSWTGATFTRLSLTDVVVRDGELSGVTFDDCTFVRVRFERCRMSGVVAPALRATDVTFDDCRMDDAWLRAGTFERVELDGCSLPRADLYSAKLTACRLTRCDLTDLELSQAVLDDVAFHGSRIDGLQGASALRNATISSEQLLAFAGPVLAAAGVTLDDDYLDGPSA